jgi:predicted DNA-binding protein
MITFEIHPELEARLERLAKKKKQTADAFARRVLLNYLEDLEDIATASRVMARVRSGKEALISHEEVLKEYGMEPGVHADRKQKSRVTRPADAQKDSAVSGRKSRAA